jgi:uncharacterized protein YecE (DUF72 family)
MAAPIIVGTANWLDHERFYPPHLGRSRGRQDRLSYYARWFSFVEVDTTFYGIPKPSTVEAWVARTPAHFRFNVKAYRSLTRHEREQRVPRSPTPEEERDFLAALAPLRSAGRLDAVHYQFPPWFTDTPRNREVLLEARERHLDDVLAIEFRHRSWYAPDAWPRTEEFLRELDAVYVMVDGPQIGSANAPPVLSVTSPRLAICRFHGRNARTWYIRNARSSADRFDYLYRPSELERWVPAIHAAADAGVPVRVVMNNNRSNYAVVNAFDMAALLGSPLARPPQGVLESMEERDGRLPAWVAEAPSPGGEPDPEQIRLGLR